MSTDPAASASTGAKKKTKKGSHTTNHASSAHDASSSNVGASSSAVAPAASTPSADALIDLMASRIDAIEGSIGGADETQPSQDEIQTVNERITTLKNSLSTLSLEEQLERLLNLYQTELTHHLVTTRQYHQTHERLQRALTQKKSAESRCTVLENLCKETQLQKKRLQEEVRIVTVDQAEAHAQMKKKFETGLSDIQAQLTKHSEDRAAQAAENDKLRENIQSLLKFDGVREEHHGQAMKTKELENQLLQAKLAQQIEFNGDELKKAKIQQEKIDYLTALETNLRTQLASYSEKFEGVQSTLTKSNELFVSFKQEMEKNAKQLKQLELDKLQLEKKAATAQLSLIEQYEARQKDATQIEKLTRQNTVLTNLCKTLQTKSAVTATTTQEVTEASEAAAETSTSESTLD